MQNAPTLDRHLLDWDDLRYVLAIARCGSLSGAARLLKVRHSTVLRRVDALEEKLNVRLFERLRSGYVPTEAGDTLRHAAEQCEPLVSEAERLIAGDDARLSGSLRITTGPFVAQYLLAGPLAQFCRAHPAIEIESRGTLESLDLSRREADVALVLALKVPDHLIGRRIATVRFRIYAWHDAPFLKGRGPRSKPIPIDTLLRDYPWIALERDVMDRPSNRWLNTHVPPASVVIRTDHFPAALSLLQTGIGVALMPEFIAHASPGMVALSAPLDDLAIPLWLLAHPDLRHNARVRAFMQQVGDALDAVLRKAEQKK